MKQLMKKLKRKWVDGKCRHLCVGCAYRNTCSSEDDSIIILGIGNKKYNKGYAEGYADGYKEGSSVIAVPDIDDFLSQL